MPDISVSDIKLSPHLMPLHRYRSRVWSVTFCCSSPVQELLVLEVLNSSTSTTLDIFYVDFFRVMFVVGAHPFIWPFSIVDTAITSIGIGYPVQELVLTALLAAESYPPSIECIQSPFRGSYCKEVVCVAGRSERCTYVKRDFEVSYSTSLLFHLQDALESTLKSSLTGNVPEESCHPCLTWSGCFFSPGSRPTGLLGGISWTLAVSVVFVVSVVFSLEYSKDTDTLSVVISWWKEKDLLFSWPYWHRAASPKLPVEYLLHSSFSTLFSV